VLTTAWLRVILYCRLEYMGDYAEVDALTIALVERYNACLLDMDDEAADGAADE
jgi:hypothetical protein